MRENVAHQEDLVLNHEELFCVNSYLGQKAAWSFLIPAAFFPGNLVLCHPVLRAAGEPCCWARTCLGSVCPGVCSEPPASSSYPHNGNFSNYVGIDTSCSAPLPLKSLRVACPSGHPSKYIVIISRFLINLGFLEISTVIGSVINVAQISHCILLRLHLFPYCDPVRAKTPV